MHANKIICFQYKCCCCVAALSKPWDTPQFHAYKKDNFCGVVLGWKVLACSNVEQDQHLKYSKNILRMLFFTKSKGVQDNPDCIVSLEF